MVSAPALVSAPVRLREMSLDDYEQVAALGVRYGFPRRSAEEWRHLWVNNPVWHKGWPIGWVLENTWGRVVGSIGSIPLEYELDGQPLIAAAGWELVVDEDYRAYAAVLLDELFHQPNVDLWLNTMVNRKASHVYSLFDAPRVPAGEWDRAAFWITGYRGFSRSVLEKRGTRLATALSWPASAALWARDFVRRANRVTASGEYEVRRESSFDDRFDAFWSHLRDRRRGVLLAVRTRAALEWHFRYHLPRKDVWIWTASRSGRMVAYAIFYRMDRPRVHLRRVRFVDYQHLEDEERSLAPLLARMLETCRREGIHMLEDLGCSMRCPFAPHRRELPSWLFHYRASTGLETALSGPARWQPTLFDGDSSL